MTCIIRILRRKHAQDEPYWQSFFYEEQSGADTVATALTFLGQAEGLTDTRGIPASAPLWQSSCLQKKCGACAMVINGRPGLACQTRLADLRGKRRRKREKEILVCLEPLRKFPVVADLIVDRTILYDNLKTLKTWLSADAELPAAYFDLAYEASECIQCGCCLEVCPNFFAGGEFFGMATVPLTMRIFAESDRAHIRDMARLYAGHVFAGCGKSLSCKGICPRGIDTEKMLVNANALAVWKRRKKS